MLGTFPALETLIPDDGRMTEHLDFDDLVRLHYPGLFRFALSLTGKESDAGDLTQLTFYVWATKGHQLRDVSKVKSWLFTTLHREFMETRRKQTRFPQHELSLVSDELPVITPEQVSGLDGLTARQMLAEVDPVFRAPVALFYLEDHSYQEIATILNVPLGTVKSRIARGVSQLQQLLLRRESNEERSVSRPP